MAPGVGIMALVAGAVAPNAHSVPDGASRRRVTAPAAAAGFRPAADRLAVVSSDASRTSHIPGSPGPSIRPHISTDTAAFSVIDSFPTDRPAPNVVAIIPARGGSKGVPHKNIRPVGGVPLIQRSVHALGQIPSIDRTYVSTDDPTIGQVAHAAGASIIRRPDELATDTATSEAALLHALDTIRDRFGRYPSILAFVQATSPFIPEGELAEAIARVRDGDEDVVFSAVRNDHFLWRVDEHGAYGVNHDKSFRPRRQEREPEWRETGAFYIISVPGFLEARHRFFGRVGIEEVPEDDSIEIDTEEELTIADAIARVRASAAAPGMDVDALVTDFDGVHTDDSVHVDQDGVESVTVSRSDGMGVRMLRESGVPVLILSTERNPVVTARARKLNVDVLQGQHDKEQAIRGWAARTGLDLARVAYIGNDVNDLGALSAVGWPVAVADAHPRVRAAARIILTRGGGHGAVREAVERILVSRRPGSRKE